MRTPPGQPRPVALRPRRPNASIVTAASSTAPVTMNLVEESNPIRSIPLLIEAITRIPNSAEKADPRPPNREVPPPG